MYISSSLGETSLQISFVLKSESAKEYLGLTLILLHQNNWLQQKASCCGLAQSPKSAL